MSASTFNIWSSGSATQTRDDLASRLGGRLSELETAGAELELDEVVALALAGSFGARCRRRRPLCARSP